jgi:hypothetical protein
MMPNKEPNDKVKCPQCPAVVQRRNLNRHRVTHFQSSPTSHGSRPADVVLCRNVTLSSGQDSRSRSTSRDSQRSVRGSETNACNPVIPNVVEQAGETFLVANESLRVPTPQLIEAARALLNERSGFSEQQLCDFVGEYCPSIPENCRRYLVIGAVAAAQYAAFEHHLWRDNIRSKDADMRRSAVEAASSLSFWTAGFRPLFRPPSKASSPDERGSGYQSATRGESSAPKLKPLEDIELPVSLQMSAVDFERVIDVISADMATEDVVLTLETTHSVSNAAVHETTVDSATAASGKQAATVTYPCPASYSPTRAEQSCCLDEYQPTPIATLEAAAKLREKFTKKKSTEAEYSQVSQFANVLDDPSAAEDPISNEQVDVTGEAISCPAEINEGSAEPTPTEVSDVAADVNPPQIETPSCGQQPSSGSVKVVLDRLVQHQKTSCGSTKFDASNKAVVKNSTPASDSRKNIEHGDTGHNKEEAAGEVQKRPDKRQATQKQSRESKQQKGNAENCRKDKNYTSSKNDGERRSRSPRDSRQNSQGRHCPASESYQLTRREYEEFKKYKEAASSGKSSYTRFAK